MIRESTIQKYVGKRYGRLVITSFSHKDGGTQYFFNCDCDCGEKRTVRIGAMAIRSKNRTQSCGCLRKEMAIKANTGNTYNRLNSGENAINRLFNRYKTDALKRGIVFEITKEFFNKTIVENCFYCETPANKFFKPKNGFGGIEYNGIDRVDNSLGYLERNCVPCCTKCNSVKNGVTKEIVTKIYHFLLLREREITSSLPSCDFQAP